MRISNSSILKLIAFSQKKNRQTDFLFPLYYIHNRCCSLLILGRQENLISSKKDNIRYLDWAISQPNDFDCPSPLKKIDSTMNAEKQLIWQILWLIDLLLDNEDYFRKNQNFLVENTCKVWTQFISECQFCGCLLYTSPSPRDRTRSRMPSSA